MAKGPHASEGSRAELEVGAGYSVGSIRQRADARVRTEIAGDVAWSEESAETHPRRRENKLWRLRAWFERPPESRPED